MKVYTRNGDLQSFPFALGEKGRGRTFEEVRLDKRNPPTGDDVGYTTFTAGGRQHCVLTAPRGQRGLLLRVDTEGCYTKGSCGSCSVIAGDATVLASGSWAYGIAGRCGSGSDRLYHVPDAAIFSVRISGGEHKGWGPRYIFVDGARDYVRCLRPQEAVQDLVTDEDPRLTELCRRFAAQLPEDLSEALAMADQLEDAPAPDASSAEVKHYVGYGHSLEGLEEMGIRIPPQHTGGLTRGPEGCLIPGEQSLVMLSVGPGGGKRYGYDVRELDGLDVLYREREHRSAREIIVALTVDPQWRVEWTNRKDGEDTETCVASALDGDGTGEWPT
jgi:hypothetical protein